MAESKKPKGLKGTDSDTVQSDIASNIQEPLAALNLKVKKVDYYYSNWARKWKYKNSESGSSVIPEMRSMLSDGKDDWGQFCFVVIKTIHQDEKQEPTFTVVIKSSYLRKAFQDVMQERFAGPSWDSVHIEVLCYFDLHFLSSFLTQ